MKRVSCSFKDFYIFGVLEGYWIFSDYFFGFREVFISIRGEVYLIIVGVWVEFEVSLL